MRLEAVRADFPISDRYIYFNNCVASPMAASARLALDQLADRLVHHPLPREPYIEALVEARELAAKLVGGSVEGAAFTRGTAHALSIPAAGLDWRPGDNVVGVAGDFPANVYPWLALKDRGVEYRRAPLVNGRIVPSAVLNLVDHRTRVVTLSWVSFWNGFRADIATIGAECRRRGVIFVVDAVQGLGALRLSVEECSIDVAAAGSYKWLLGPKAFAICYVRPEIVDRIRPVLIGTGTVRQNWDYFTIDYDLEPTARRFEESAIAIHDLVHFSVGARILLDAGLDRVERRILTLAGRLADGLARAGASIVEPWPRVPGEDSGIVSFRTPGKSSLTVFDQLLTAGVVGRAYQDFIRFAPHIFNTEAEVDEVARLVGQALDGHPLARRATA